MHTCGELCDSAAAFDFLYCRRYLNRKEIVLPSTSDSMAVVSTMLYTLKVLTMFYALDVQVFILLNRSNTMQGRKTCARRHKKNAPRTEKHVQEDKKKIRRRDLVGGLFSFSPHQLSLSCSLLRTGPIFNPLYQCKLLACSTAELQHFSSTCSLILFRLVRAKTAKR